MSNFCTGDDACRNPPGAANHAITCPKFGVGSCVGFEPHPWLLYAEEFCVAPVYVDGRPRYCGRPRKEHAPALPTDGGLKP